MLEKKKRTRNKELKLACDPQMADINKKKEVLKVRNDRVVRVKQNPCFSCKRIKKNYIHSNTGEVKINRLKHDSKIGPAVHSLQAYKETKLFVE